MLATLDRWLTAFETACLAAGTAVAVVVATVQVFLRYFFGTGFFWAEEVTVYACIWTAFLAAGLAVRGGEHLSVEMIQLVAGKRHARTLARLIAVAGLAAAAALLVYGIAFVESARDFGQTSPALQCPMWIIYLVLPLSGALMSIRFIQQIISPSGPGRSAVGAEDDAW
jgi:C4-dicarboxylate transporter DctQ subunit